MISEPLENVLKRDRVVVTTALAVLTALAWLYVLRLAANMGSETQIAGMPAMPGMPGMSAAAPAVGPWSAGEIGFAFFMWAVMMVGMMTPSAAPMILLYAQVGRRARAALSSSALLTPMLASASNLFAGMVLIAAGVYQWTPLKNACLWQCQVPFAFLSRNGGFKRDPLGSLGLGFKHGLYCVGCCWALMALLFVVGVMNVLWIAGLAILILLEKSVPGGRFPSRALGLVLVVAGAIFLYRTRM